MQVPESWPTSSTSCSSEEIDMSLSNRQKWRAWLRYIRALEQHGYALLVWRALQKWELYEYWRAGLISEQEAIILYWHTDI